MEADVQQAFKDQGEILASIGGNVEEIKEAIHGQAMAIREVDHGRQLCRAQMNQEVGEAAKAAQRADEKAELAHKRVSGLSRAAWGLVLAILLQLVALVLWMIKTGLAAKLGGG